MFSDSQIETYPEYQYKDSYLDVLCKFTSYGMLAGLGGYYFAKFMGWIA
jgi:hypothetical protein